MSPDYVLCHESRVDEFIAGMKRKMQAAGADKQSSTQYGRVVNQRHVGRLKQLIETSGGHIELGGTADIDVEDRHPRKKEHSDPRSSTRRFANVGPWRYVPMTIIRNPAPDSPIMAEEIFGPVLVVKPVKSVDEAIQHVQGMDDSLALYVYTEDKQARAMFGKRSLHGEPGCAPWNLRGKARRKRCEI